ncbi:MAG: diaminopimelate epimerase [Bacteroidota bacterium]
MHFPFYKYQGTGNDFIIVDNRQGVLSGPMHPLIPKLCDRRLGIGADGLILLQNRSGFDFEMIYYNADGSQSLCGNGSRCAVHLAHYLGIVDQEAHFWTSDGAHDALRQDGLIHIKMHDVTGVQSLQKAYFLDNGSPHYVAFVTALEAQDVAYQGSIIQDQPPFQKEGTNVNFVQLAADNTLLVRTYERGVAAETLSCGTGAVASALVAATIHDYISPIPIKTRGGTLQVHFVRQPDGTFSNIALVGPAAMVFQGVYYGKD